METLAKISFAAIAASAALFAGAPAASAATAEGYTEPPTAPGTSGSSPQHGAAQQLPPPGQPSVPSVTPNGENDGGAAYDPRLNQVRKQREGKKRRRGSPVLASFSVSRTAVFAYGRPVTIGYQVNDRSRFVRVRLAFVREGSKGALFRINLGRKRTGVAHRFRWRGTNSGELAKQGAYHFRISARDPDGNRLVRSSARLGGTPLEVRNHRFPVLGRHDFGGPDARFGARRSGHRHQGQDILAPEGTPIVAPRGGVVTNRAFQEGGAGYYLVITGEGEAYNYVFMHLQRGSLLVRQGELVKTGQQIASLGSTGASSAPHLHFEIWDGPWYNGGKPFDPLPLLRNWDSSS